MKIYNMKFYSYFDGETVFTNISGTNNFFFFFGGGGGGEVEVGVDKSPRLSPVAYICFITEVPLEKSTK